MSKKKLLLGAALLLTGAAGFLAWHTNGLAIAYHWARMQTQASAWQENGIWLPHYRAAVEGRPIEGVARNASGLTYSTKTGTLFSVINQPPEIIELDTEGRLLRRIPLDGATDTEGITHVRDDVFVLADERGQQLYRIEIPPRAARIDVRDAPRLGLAIDARRNLGFEGVSWDHANHRLFVVKEKAPLRVLAIAGLPELLAGRRFDLQISEWQSARASALFMTDLSSLSFHEATGNMLLLSDESALIVEYAPDGSPVSMLPMWRGLHGLTRRVPQAEGIAVGPDGAIYVLSEPNLFYRFEREPRARWAENPALAGR